MRIVDEWNENEIKVTIFHMNGRYSLKAESLLLEQTYKFRDGQFTSVGEIRSSLNGKFWEAVKSTFKNMHEIRQQLSVNDEDPFVFEEII